MEDWIVILLIISTVLACWSFSLLLRLISEFVARKQKRLRAEHQRAGIQRALIAMAMGLIGSAISVWYAFDLAQQTGSGDLDDAGVVFAVSLGIAMFSLMLIIWAAIGDRSRGRLRCPCCWYDMEGIDTPQCPECGRAIKSQRQLRRARRVRWPFVLAAIGLGLSIYGFANQNRVQDSDRLALVPTWFMMLAWEHLPEDWILGANSTYIATLDRRIAEENLWYFESEIQWISDDQRHAFLVKLCNGMLESTEARWSSRRMMLIAELMNPASYVRFEYDDGRAILSEHIPIDAERLMQRTVEDLITAMNTDSPSVEQLDMLHGNPWAWWMGERFTPSFMSTVLLLRNIDEDMNEDGMSLRAGAPAENKAYFEERDKRYSDALDAVASRIDLPLDTAAFRDAVLSDSQNIQSNTVFVLDVTRQAHRFISTFMSDETGDDLCSLSNRATRLAHSSMRLDADEIESVFQQLQQALAGDDLTQQGLASTAILAVQRIRELPELRQSARYQECIRIIKDKMIGGTEPVFDDDPAYSSSRNLQALRIIANDDPTGETSFPLIASYYADPNIRENELVYFNHELTAMHAQTWIAHLMPFTQSDRDFLRAWAAQSIPAERGSEHDETIDSIVHRMAVDPNEVVRWHARQIAEQRGIEVPPEPEQEL